MSRRPGGRQKSRASPRSVPSRSAAARFGRSSPRRSTQAMPSRRRSRGSPSAAPRAPPMAAVLPGFLDFARGRVLIAHNAPFDIGFLSAACAACGVPWPACQVLDTVVLARQVLGEDEVPNHKLSTLASFFGAGTPPCHRALADARATADVLAGLLRRLAAAGVRSFAEICELGSPAADPLGGGTLSLAGGTPGPMAGAHSAEGGIEWSPRSFW